MRCGVDSALPMLGEHICGFLRGVERLGARELRYQDAVEREGSDGIRIGVACAERIQKRLYQSSGKEDAVLWKVRSWNSLRSCFKF